MIIDREKENGTLTDNDGKDIIELLDVTCGYLLKDEPELKKEVHGIMRPLIVLQSERIEKAEHEIRRITEKMQRVETEKQRVETEKQRVETEKQRIESEKQRIETEKQRIETEKQRIESEKDMYSERNETAIQKSVEKYRASGQNRQEVKESIQDIFSLSAEEAGEKVGKYWKQKDEQQISSVTE